MCVHCAQERYSAERESAAEEEEIETQTRCRRPRGRGLRETKSQVKKRFEEGDDHEVGDVFAGDNFSAKKDDAFRRCVLAHHC